MCDMQRYSYSEADLPVQLSEYFSKAVRYTNIPKLFKWLKKLHGVVVNIVNETVLLPTDPLNPVSPLEPGDTLTIVLPSETTEKSVLSFFQDINTTHTSFLQARIAPDKNLFPDQHSQSSYTFCTKPSEKQCCFKTVFNVLRENVLVDRFVQARLFDFEQICHDGDSFFGFSAVTMSNFSTNLTGFSEWMLQTPITTFIVNLKATVQNHALLGLRLSDTAVSHIIRRLDVALSYQHEFSSVNTTYCKMKAELARDCPAGADVDSLYMIPSFVWDNEVFLIRYYSGGVQCVYGLNRRGVQHQAQQYLQEQNRLKDRFLEDLLPRQSGCQTPRDRASVRERRSVRTWPGNTHMEMERHTYTFHEKNRIPGVTDLHLLTDERDSWNSRTIRHAGSVLQ